MTTEDDRTAQYGFTLLELMLVAAIILAMVGISTPVFKRTYDDLRLASSAKEMAAIMRFCRERAIFERRIFKVKIDAEEKSYQVLAEDEGKEEFAPLKSRWGRPFKLAESIEVEADKEEIDFTPDGSAAPALIYLTNKKGKTHTILTEQDTGLVKVYDYKKE